MLPSLLTQVPFPQVFVALVIGLTSSIVAIVYICLLPLILQTYTPAWICWHLTYGHWNLIMIVFHYYKAITTSPGHPPQVRTTRHQLQLGPGSTSSTLRAPGGRAVLGGEAGEAQNTRSRGQRGDIPSSDLCAGQERCHRRLHLQEMHRPQAGSHPPLQHLQQVGLPGPAPTPLFPCRVLGGLSPFPSALLASLLALAQREGPGGGCPFPGTVLVLALTLVLLSSPLGAC